jgi:hypothetical protein
MAPFSVGDRAEKGASLIRAAICGPALPGLFAIADAVTCKFLNAPLTAEQLKTLIQLQEPSRWTGFDRSAFLTYF